MRREWDALLLTLMMTMLMLMMIAHVSCSYVKTDQLDGESNLKIRRARAEAVSALATDDSLAGWRGLVECGPPNADFGAS